MHKLSNLTSTIWYIVRNSGNVIGVGYCSPGQEFISCADILETFNSEEDQKARLAELDYTDIDSTVVDTQSLTLEQQRHILCHRINALRDNKLLEPISFNGNSYDADEKSVANLTGIVAAISAGITLPDNFTWRTYDNKNVSFNAVMVLQLAASIMSRQNELYNKSWELKDLINSSDDLSNIDILSGW